MVMCSPVHGSDRRAASTQQWLRQCNIKAVVNCTVNVQHFFEKELGADSSSDTAGWPPTYMRIPVLTPQAATALAERFASATAFTVRQMRTEDDVGVVLIHRHAGRSRSATVLAAHSMYAGPGHGQPVSAATALQQIIVRRWVDSNSRVP